MKAIRGMFKMGWFGLIFLVIVMMFGCGGGGGGWSGRQLRQPVDQLVG